VTKRLLLSSFSLLLTAACGAGALPNNRAPSTSQALTGTAEWLEFEAPALRTEMFRDVARTSQNQAGLRATGQMVFPMMVNGEFVAAPGIDPRMDLLMSADAGGAIQLSFDGRADRWSDDRRDSFQGLSEREAVELIARSLVQHWGVARSNVIRVDRVAGAPYAAAYIDGILRVNPAFVYMATATSAP
jgi:hypothetical protein